jgi:transposase
VPYEAPKDRRVNVVGALSSRRDHLFFECRGKSEGRYDASAHVRFVRQIKAQLAQEPRAAQAPVRPLIVVVDNYSVHHSRLVKEQQGLLAAQGIHFLYLPAYCPELNEIEPLWRQIKYHDLPVRSYTSEPALKSAVQEALQKRAEAMAQSNTDLTICA